MDTLIKEESMKVVQAGRHEVVSAGVLLSALTFTPGDAPQTQAQVAQNWAPAH
jgi:hypothetical protein